MGRELKIKEEAKKIIEKSFKEIGEYFAYHSDKYNKFKKLVSSIMQDFYNTKITIRKDSYTGGCHLYFTIQKSSADFSNIKSFNQYAYYDNNSKYNDEVKEILDALLFVINKFRYDNSEPMTDYYDTNFYYSVEVSEKFEQIKTKKSSKENTKTTTEKISGLKIIDYTENVWAIIGDTKAIKEEIKQLYYDNDAKPVFGRLKKLNSNDLGWFFPKEIFSKEMLEDFCNSFANQSSTNSEEIKPIEKGKKVEIKDIPYLLKIEFFNYFSIPKQVHKIINDLYDEIGKFEVFNKRSFEKFKSTLIGIMKDFYGTNIIVKTKDIINSRTLKSDYCINVGINNSSFDCKKKYSTPVFVLDFILNKFIKSPYDYKIFIK